MESFSGPPEVFLVAPDENTVWGGATSGSATTSRTCPRRRCFPGLVTIALALAGLASAVLPRALRYGLGLGALSFSVLALGFQVSDGLLWPYRIAYEVLPGSRRDPRARDGS